ncbi:MAG: sporulation protein YqfC [Bacillota bacterium]
MKQDKIKSKVADIFDLPPDVVLNLPVINLTGSLNLVMENHQGIKQYSTEQIEIKAKRGSVIIRGADLKIDYLSETKITILGQIEQLDLDCN